MADARGKKRRAGERAKEGDENEEGKSKTGGLDGDGCPPTDQGIVRNTEDKPKTKKTKENPKENLHQAKPSSKPARVVRLQRKGGQVVQDCDVYIGRRWTMGGWNLPQSKWANPFTVRKAGSAAEAVRLYEEDHLRQRPDLMAALGELRGKSLGCWCKKKPSDPCHGDVLARLANALDQST